MSARRANFSNDQGNVTNQRRFEATGPARPAILQRYLQLAPGARAHIPVDRDAPVTEFERIAADYPVFRIVTASPQAG